jgi:hypothetical protein
MLLRHLLRPLATEVSVEPRGIVVKRRKADIFRLGVQRSGS